MDILKREIAPIVPAAWAEIDDEARRVLRPELAGRHVVDVDGPHGWDFAAINTGKLELLDEEPQPGVHVGLRVVRPLIEVRTPFVLDLLELDTAARGAPDIELQPVVDAALRMARFEDGVLFNGYAPAGVTGIIAGSPHEPISIPAADRYPHAIAAARERLYRAGVDGPYALVLSPECDEELSQATDDGYPIRKLIDRQLIDGPLVRSQAIDGAVLISRRGGDFSLTIGQDLSIGYASHDRDRVELYLTESLTVQTLEPAAAIHLTRSAKGKKR